MFPRLTGFTKNRSYSLDNISITLNITIPGWVTCIQIISTSKSGKPMLAEILTNGMASLAVDDGKKKGLPPVKQVKCKACSKNVGRFVKVDGSIELCKKCGGSGFVQ